MGTNMTIKQMVRNGTSLKDWAEYKRLPSVIFHPNKRVRLWELRDRYHCPIIGTCLSIDELEKFARRFDLACSQTDAFTLHVAIINKSSARNPLSKAIQKYLDDKYKTVVTHFNQAKSDAEVVTLWQTYLSRGNGASGMWASLTHKAVSEKTREMIYAEMHMYSHQVGAGQAVDLRKLNHLEQENTKLNEALELQQRRHALAKSKWQQKLNKATKALEDQQRQQLELEQVRKDLAKLESGKAITDMGKRLMALTYQNDKLQAAAQRVNQLEKLLYAANDEITKLTQEREALAEERDLLENLMQSMINNTNNNILPAGDERQRDMPSSGHGCVLCVGGRIALLPQYRTLAHHLGFNLIHHDGGWDEAVSRLPELINRAHTVICPTDCVSHAAYYLLKRHCKRHQKTCLLYKGAGVSSFAKALTQLTSGKTRKGRLNGYVGPVQQAAG